MRIKLTAILLAMVLSFSIFGFMGIGENIAHAEEGEPTTYTVTFRNQAASLISSMVVDAGTVIETIDDFPAPPERPGYTFVWWSFNRNEMHTGEWNSQIQLPYTVTSDITLYTVWGPGDDDEIYVITFDSQGGSPALGYVRQSASGDGLNNGGPIWSANISPPLREGYVFTGWFTAPTGGTKAGYIDVSNDTTYYAQWIEGEPYSCTIYFDTGAGSLIDPMIVEAGTVIDWEDLSFPTRDGNTFLNWKFKGDDNLNWWRSCVQFPYTVTSDIVFYASWQAGTDNVILLTFDSQGGSPALGYIRKGATSDTFWWSNALQPIPTKPGYIFLGWFKDPLTGSETTKFNQIANTTFYAHWEEITITEFTITFNTTGGSSVDPITAEVDTLIEMPTPPTRAGYTFLGWFTAATGGEEITFPYMPSDDITMYAQWAQQSTDPPVEPDPAEVFDLWAWYLSLDLIYKILIPVGILIGASLVISIFAPPTRTGKRRKRK